MEAIVGLFFSFFGFKIKFKKKIITPQDLNLTSPKVLKVLKLFFDRPGQWLSLLIIAGMVDVKADDTRSILNYLRDEKLLQEQSLGFFLIIYALDEGARDRVAEILLRHEGKKLLNNSTQS